MSKQPHKNKQNITKISAHSEPTKTNTKAPEATKTNEKVAKVTSKASAKPSTKSAKSRPESDEKPLREVFILVRPFVALGRYLRDSWREIRQVRWPNRKATWKMTLAVLVYCAIFFAFILLLDTFFTFIFNLLLGINK